MQIQMYALILPNCKMQRFGITNRLWRAEAQRSGCHYQMLIDCALYTDAQVPLLSANCFPNSHVIASMGRSLHCIVLCDHCIGLICAEVDILDQVLETFIDVRSVWSSFSRMPLSLWIFFLATNIEFPLSSHHNADDSRPCSVNCNTRMSV